MTFTQIVTRIMNHCGLTSSDATTRVGIDVNEHYRATTSKLGLDPTRFVTRSQSTTTTVRTVTFTSIESIDRVIDGTTATAIRELDPVGIDEIRNITPQDAPPTKYAIQSMTATSITIVMDNAPTALYTLKADGKATLSDLSGTDVPVIPESYHGILVAYGIAEELLRKEKPQLAAVWATFDEKRPGRAENLLMDLRFQLADGPMRSTVQAKNA